MIARLVSACRPAVQLSKIITISQLEHLIRMAVWNDQQQPWAVHAITCLLQVYNYILFKSYRFIMKVFDFLKDLLDADKHFKDKDATPTNDGINLQETIDLFAAYTCMILTKKILKRFFK